jgi:hypothetical protein
MILIYMQIEWKGIVNGKADKKQSENLQRALEGI